MSSKTSRGERSWEISRTVTAVRNGDEFEIEPTNDSELQLRKTSDYDPKAACLSKGTFCEADALRFGLTKSRASISDSRNSVQLSVYVALCRDAALLNVDRLSQRLVTPQFGALATFVGVSRRDRHPETSAATNRLVYEAYEQMALSELDRICVAAQRRFGVSIALVHRVGEVLLAEPSFTCVCAAAHRDAAFDAVRFAVTEVKARVPIWKREHFEDGSCRWLANSECFWTATAANLLSGAWNNLDTVSCKREPCLLQSQFLADSLAAATNGDAEASTTSSLNGNGSAIGLVNIDTTDLHRSDISAGNIAVYL